MVRIQASPRISLGPKIPINNPKETYNNLTEEDIKQKEDDQETGMTTSQWKMKY